MRRWASAAPIGGRVARRSEGFSGLHEIALADRPLGAQALQPASMRMLRPGPRGPAPWGALREVARLRACAGSACSWMCPMRREARDGSLSSRASSSGWSARSLRADHRSRLPGGLRTAPGPGSAHRRLGRTHGARAAGCGGPPRRPRRRPRAGVAAFPARPAGSGDGPLSARTSGALDAVDTPHRLC